jgi:hypothetical protein
VLVVLFGIVKSGFKRRHGKDKPAMSGVKANLRMSRKKARSASDSTVKTSYKKECQEKTPLHEEKGGFAS